MSYKRIIATLSATAAVVGVPAASASAATTDPQAALSQNWSGYVVGSSSGNTSFSNVSGSWVQPTAKCSSGQGDAAFWVGIGGAGQSDALEQTGTQADCNADGSTDYYAWYELVPAAPVKLDMTISPGDHMSGKVNVSGTNVTITLSDQTTGQSVTKTLQMSNPDTSSAEWIAEAPSECDTSGDCQPLALSDFGTVQFTNALATANGHTGTISDPDWTAQPVALGSSGAYDASYAYGQATSTAGANPSSLSSDGSSFSVTWQQNGATSASSSGDGYGGGGSGGSNPYGDAGNGSGGSNPYGDAGNGYPGGGYPGGYAYPGGGYGGGYGYAPGGYVYGYAPGGYGAGYAPGGYVYGYAPGGYGAGTGPSSP